MSELSVELSNKQGSSLILEADDTTEVSSLEVDLSEKPLSESLPPVDRGKHAWLFLVACFFADALTWGFPNTFGVFQEYYNVHEPFAGSSGIPIIGTCTLGVMYLDMPIVMGIQRLYPRFGRLSPFIGLLVMSVSLGISSYSQTTLHLIVTQGIFFAIGSSILFCPCLLYFEQWFVQRKGIAFGIMLSGTGLAGAVLPMIMEYLLNRYGFRTTLRIWAISLVILTAPLAYFIKPRLPAKVTTPYELFNFGFAFKRKFIFYQVSNICQALGFFLPSIYLPTYALGIGASQFLSAFTLVLLNLASMVGSALMGLLTDHIHATWCLLISATGSALSTFLLWGFATELPLLFLFCATYGLFAGSYPSAWPGITRHVASSEDVPKGWDGHNERKTKFDPTMIWSMLAFGRGIGSVISGPLSHALIRGMPWYEDLYGGYGTGYGPLIIFTGVCSIMSGTTFIWRKFGWM